MRSWSAEGRESNECENLSLVNKKGYPLSAITKNCILLVRGRVVREIVSRKNMFSMNTQGSFTEKVVNTVNRKKSPL